MGWMPELVTQGLTFWEGQNGRIQMTRSSGQETKLALP